MAAPALEPALAALLAASGRDATRFALEPLAAGGNNRVFAVLSRDERLVAKCYYHDPADPRDRLAAEYAFLEHAWRIGLRCVPRPVARDPQAHVALYEHVEGARLDPAAVDAARVAEAARFFAALNTAESHAAARGIGVASEACFSPAEHLRMVDGRIARLETIPAHTPIEREAREFCALLGERWRLVRRDILAAVGDAQASLPAASRCLSPSDFGFHNALGRPDGTLCFLDFEYAGWDDPAKAVGDFFAHPGVPVAREHFDTFVDIAGRPFGAGLAARARLLEPVFRIKWCCIVLNEFLPDPARRRRYADPAAGTEPRRRAQLAKARALLDSLPR
jgi:hypothetical protein